MQQFILILVICIVLNLLSCLPFGLQTDFSCFQSQLSLPLYKFSLVTALCISRIPNQFLRRLRTLTVPFCQPDGPTWNKNACQLFQDWIKLFYGSSKVAIVQFSYKEKLFSFSVLMTISRLSTDLVIYRQSPIFFPITKSLFQLPVCKHRRIRFRKIFYVQKNPPFICFLNFSETCFLFEVLIN